MSFEEFLIKKKIDPVQLKNAEQALFSKFNSHFNEMGEKSFDHSKKFWFNKLRRAYHLIEVPKAEPITLSSPISIPDLPVITPTSIESEIKKELVEGEITTPKPAFKPRFKANIITTIQEQPTDPGSSIAAERIETAADPEKPKPTYKPRFKPTMIRKDPEQE
jgi:hypothetical protein